MHLKLVNICLLAILVIMDTATGGVALRASLLCLRQALHHQGHHGPDYNRMCWHGEQHIFWVSASPKMFMKCFLAFAAESLLLMAIVLFRLGWKTVRINQFTSHSLRFHIDTHWSQIEVWECVRGKIGQVGVDRLKQVTPRWVLVPLPHSSGRHYYLDMLNLSSPLFDQKRPSFPTYYHPHTYYHPQQLTAHRQVLLPGYNMHIIQICI